MNVCSQIVSRKGERDSAASGSTLATARLSPSIANRSARQLLIPDAAQGRVTATVRVLAAAFAALGAVWEAGARFTWDCAPR